MYFVATFLFLIPLTLILVGWNRALRSSDDSPDPTGELGAERLLWSLPAWLYERDWLSSLLCFTEAETGTV
jgi:hypothetical protein